MRILAIDLGKRRSGVAFAETSIGIVMALDVIHHSSTDELLSALQGIVSEKKINSLAIGLPLLPDGTEGEQADYVREIAAIITQKFLMPIEFIDERYSSHGTTKENADVKAACSIAEIAMARKT